MDTIMDAAETWGSAQAAMLGAHRGQEVRNAGVKPEDIDAGPLSGEWTGDLTPMMLAYEVLGDDYDLDANEDGGVDDAAEVLADAYEDAFWAVLAGEATACGPLTTVNAICESPGTYCDHDLTRTSKEG